MSDRLAALFEGAPGFLARLDGLPRSGARGTFFERCRAIAHAMPEVDQVELLDAHPRLGAPPGTVSTLSFHEQGYDRHEPDAGSPVDVAEELDRLNDAYEGRFGFRYCVFVAGRTRAELLPGFRRALDGDRAAELHRGLDAVIDIAIDRDRRLAGSG